MTTPLPTVPELHRILARLGEHCRTTRGEALAQQATLGDTPDAVRAMLTLTTEMRALLDTGDAVPFGGITDLEPMLARVERLAILEAPELIAVADALRGLWLLRRFLIAPERAVRVPHLAALALVLPELASLADDLYETFDADGNIKDDATPELLSLRSRRRSLHERVRRRIHELVGDPVVQGHLQDDYYTVREDRYVLPVRAGEKHDVAGIIHASSQTGKTLFVEPAELVPLNNELKLCEHAVREEERRVLAQRTGWVLDELAPLREGLQRGAELDLAHARGRLSEEMRAAPPTLTPHRVRLLAVRNPVLVLRGVGVVPNDVVLGGDGPRLLVLTGPNAGGKTVTLSTLGLCALMARLGLHLPASPDSELPVFGTVHTVLGDQQDLVRDLSTFSGHLARLAEVLAALEVPDPLGRPTLVLLDEAVVGTEPTQGAALAVAVVEAIVDRGALGIVTTHYERLKTLSFEDPRFQNAAVGLDPRTHAPTYKLIAGRAGASSPLELAARMGFLPSVIVRAETLVSEGLRSVDRVLDRLEAERAAAELARTDVERLRHEVQRELERLTRERQELERSAERHLQDVRAEAKKKIDDAVRELDRIQKEAERDRAIDSLDRRRREVRGVEEQLKSLIERTVPKSAGALEALAPGQAVFVSTVRKNGTLVEVRGTQALVMVGPMRLTVPRESLGPARAESATAAPKRVGAPLPFASGGSETEGLIPPRNPGNTCDVRGMLFADAASEMDRFLDASMLSDRDVVFVLHGHGTNKLKTGLRDRLRTSRYVARHAPADADHGGDGVTVVWMK